MTACSTETGRARSPRLGPSSDRRSLSSSFAWTLAANVLYAISQWAIFALLARAGGARLVGEYAYAVALCVPVLQLAGMQLKEIQGVDAAGRYRPAAYFWLRLFANGAAVIVVAALALGTPAQLATIAAVAFARATEGLFDVAYGHLQRHDRMDLVAKASMAKSVLSVPAVAAGPLLFGSLAIGALLLAASRVVVAVAVDRAFVRTVDPAATTASPFPRLATMTELARMAIPAGLVMGAVALNANIPRYFLERERGVASVGIHASVFYFAIAMSFIVVALCDAALPRLAAARHDGDREGFQRLLVRLATVAAIVGIGATLTTIPFTRTILTIAYGGDFGAHARSLSVAFGVGTLSLVATVVGCGLTAMRAFRAFLALVTGACGVSAIASWSLVPRLGVDGALLAFGAAAAAQIIAGAIILAWLMRSSSRNANESDRPVSACAASATSPLEPPSTPSSSSA